MTGENQLPALGKIVNKPKNRMVAVMMALLGTVTPIAGIHKFYLGQPLWGVIYLLLWSTPIPRFACAIEAVWYLLQDSSDFDHRFNTHLVPGESPRGISIGDYAHNQEEAISKSVEDIADALRQLDQLREDGLLSEYEFEQKRRQLIDHIA